MTMRPRAAAPAILLFAAILAGCATNAAPDASRLHQTQAAARQRVPVIIIPGVLGSRLADRETGVEAWPGSTARLLTSGYLELALRVDPVTLEPVDDGLVASGLFDGAAGQDFYRRVIETLQEVGGYRRGQPGQPAKGQEPQFYTFAYDWRQDNVISVRKLDELIEKIRRDYGNPELQVDVIAHSMGGLILRYYERYGTDDVLDGNFFPVTGAGARKLRRVVLLGTPNQGSVTGIHSFLHGYRVALSRLPTEGIATMPSMYQLFPHPLVTWIITTSGVPLRRDLFDVNVWRRLEWSVFDRKVRRRIEKSPGIWPTPEVFGRYFEKHLERARRFVWSLNVPTGDVGLIAPLVFGGDCVPTPAKLVVEEVDGDSAARLRPEQITRPVRGVNYDALMYEPGDGSVTMSSLLGRQEPDPSVPRHEYANVEFKRTFFVCADHTALTGNAIFLDKMMNHLLSAD